MSTQFKQIVVPLLSLLILLGCVKVYELEVAQFLEMRKLRIGLQAHLRDYNGNMNMIQQFITQTNQGFEVLDRRWTELEARKK